MTDEFQINLTWTVNQLSRLCNASFDRSFLVEQFYRFEHIDGYCFKDGEEDRGGLRWAEGGFLAAKILYDYYLQIGCEAAIYWDCVEEDYVVWKDGETPLITKGASPGIYL